MRSPDGDPPFPLTATLAVFFVAFTALAWPWLSGSVTIPWDAKAQFQPSLAFLANSLARGESPFWTANKMGVPPALPGWQ